MAIIGPNGQEIDPASMNPTTMESLPPDAFTGATADDMAAMPPDVMEGMTADMMTAIPPAAMGGMDADMMAAMPPTAMEGKNDHMKAKLTHYEKVVKDANMMDVMHFTIMMKNNMIFSSFFLYSCNFFMYPVSSFIFFFIGLSAL